MMLNIYTNNNDAATNATNVKNAFDNNVTGYFSNIEVDTTSSNSYVYIKFYLDSSSENPDMTISLNTSATLASFAQLIVGSSTYNISFNADGGSNRIYRVIITDNGIVLQTSVDGGAYNSSVVICKSESGHILVIFHGSSNISNMSSNYNSATDNIRVIDLNEQSTYTYNHNISYNNSNQVLGIPFVNMTSGASKNVYLPITRCFTGINEAFKYQINGENYIGIGYNSIIIKSE